MSVQRPCPWLECRYNLEAERRSSGSRWQGYTPKQRRGRLPMVLQSCALDVADEGGVTLEEVGDQLGVTRERVRQIETIALRKILARSASSAPVVTAVEARLLREAVEP